MERGAENNKMNRFTKKEFNIPGRTAKKSINPFRDALYARTVNIDRKLGYAGKKEESKLGKHRKIHDKRKPHASRHAPA